jgi:hypothetical protein
MNRKLLNDIRKATSKRNLLRLSEMLNKESPPHTKYSKKEFDCDKITTRTEKRILKDTKTKII